MLKAIKIRLYPNKTQEVYIGKLLGAYRFVYNQCLSLKKEKYIENKNNLGLKQLGNFYHQNLTKNEEYKWLNEHNTKVLKQSIITMLDAYKRFFVNGAGFPKFKSKHDKQSCRFPLEAISKRNDYLSNRLTLTSDLKNVKFSCSDKYTKYLDKYKDGIKSATLSKSKSGKYFLSILVNSDEIIKENKPHNDFIGLDLGIKDFIITSEGKTYENIKIKRNNDKKLVKLNRLLSKKQKGSKNKNKARIKLARFHEKLNNKKENYLHSVTNQLLNENQVIVIESLNVKGMMQNHKLAKSIQELSLYRFKEMLRYKSDWYGNSIVEIDRFYPSSKLCSVCGYKKDDLTLKDRKWACPDCGSIHNRDVNAAINILNEGKRLLNNKIPIRCGKLTPLESSDYMLNELGNRDLHNFV
jgi:putative transposase